MKKLLLFGTACLVQLGYWSLLRHGFQRAQRRAGPAPSGSDVGISVVVAARDEAHNMPCLLAALARQTHPRFEVLIVDDASTDGTAEAVHAWAAAHLNIRLVQVSHPRAPRKKHALAQGIQAAVYDRLAFTDADCRPPPDWLALLARQHAVQADVLLIGYGPYLKRGGLLNKLIRYETLVTAFLTAAAVGLDRPYMAVGRNLSYSKAVFRRTGGFARSLQSITGDDDLFVQEAARRGEAAVRYLFDARSFVPSEAPASWRHWLRQKRRHTSGGRYYARDIQRHLALFHGTGILLWLAPLVAGWAGAALLGAKLLAQRCTLQHAARIFEARDLLPLQPLLELLYALYNLLVAPLGLLHMPKRW